MLTIRETQKKDMAQSSPNKSVVQPCPDKLTWIEVELVDDDGNPIGSEAYKITLPDGSIRTGNLDGDGKARFDGIQPGSAQIAFPNLDGREWKPA